MHCVNYRCFSSFSRFWCSLILQKMPLIAPGAFQTPRTNWKGSVLKILGVGILFRSSSMFTALLFFFCNFLSFEPNSDSCQYRREILIKVIWTSNLFSGPFTHSSIFLLTVCRPCDNILANRYDTKQDSCHFGQAHFPVVSVVVQGWFPIWKTIFEYVVIPNTGEIALHLEQNYFLVKNITFPVSIDPLILRKQILNF